MVSVKFFMLLLVRHLLADVATCSAPDLCKDELAIDASDFALAVGKEGPDKSLELLQVKKVPWQHQLFSTQLLQLLPCPVESCGCTG